MITYLRMYCVQYYNEENIEVLMATIPISIKYEIFILEFTVKLFEYLLK